MSAPPCHFLPSLETALPLCGEAAVLATYCTMNPLLVTCPQCQRASMAHASPRHAVHTVGIPMAESDLLTAVRHIATRHGWLLYHTFRSDHSPAGFPDCVLARPGRLAFAELKSARGKLTREQLQWLSILERSVPGVEVYTWKPADLEQVRELLRRP